MEYDIKMVRGDTYPFSIVIDGDTPAPVDVKMTVKVSPRLSASPLFQLTLEDGITITEDGFDVRVPPSATENLNEGNYYYDVQFTYNGTNDDDVYTPIRGAFRILADYTTPAATSGEEET